MIHKAQAKPKQVVFPEGDNEKILRACHILLEEKIAIPILLGELADDPQRRLRSSVLDLRRRANCRSGELATTANAISRNCFGSGNDAV